MAGVAIWTPIGSAGGLAGRASIPMASAAAIDAELARHSLDIASGQRQRSSMKASGNVSH